MFVIPQQYSEPADHAGYLRIVEDFYRVLFSDDLKYMQMPA